MPGGANLGGDVDRIEDDVAVNVSVADCDDVKVGTKKRPSGTGLEVRHGDAIFPPCSEDGESLNEECEGDGRESGSEGFECEEEVRRLCDNYGSKEKPFFMLGMTFANTEEIKRAINQYAITEGVKVRILKSEPSRIRIICQEGCPFVFYASKEGDKLGLKVKTLCCEHSCLRVFKNPRASAKWLAGHFKAKVQERPKYKASDMKKDVEFEFKLHVSIHKCKRAKKLIMEEMKGSNKGEFGNLEGYGNELRTLNSGSDVNVEGQNEANCQNCGPSTSTNTVGKKRERPEKVSASCNQQSQITQEEQRQPITVRPKLPVRSYYKKGGVCGMGIRHDLETGCFF